jgi:hypothetical protein
MRRLRRGNCDDIRARSAGRVPAGDQTARDVDFVELTEGSCHMATKRARSAVSRLELKPRDLRWTCDPALLGFATTEELECRFNLIGQDRALDAIRLGLTLYSPGYNIFVSGLTGVGKLTAIRSELEGMDLSARPLRRLPRPQLPGPAARRNDARAARRDSERLRDLPRTITEVRWSRPEPGVQAQAGEHRGRYQAPP